MDKIKMLEKEKSTLNNEVNETHFAPLVSNEEKFQIRQRVFGELVK
jgi:hypothetical protein